MKSFLTNTGVFLVLLGVLFLITPFFTSLQTNGSLLTGWILVTVGMIVYTLTKKYIN
ncbi:MAG: hypothetical protein LBS25_06065 [Candidatus Symbiothrix sp.]|nr:hypothetical protein [Candidatus Symbiothrix sp.]